MRTVEVRPPSFPVVDPNEPLKIKDSEVWQVLCGDKDRWRVGIYCPEAGNADELAELESHDCPELFYLLEGRVTLLLARNRQVEQVELEIGKPMLVTAPHAGFCPDGPLTGKVLVVERDKFDTKYATPKEFTTNQTLNFEPVEEES